MLLDWVKRLGQWHLAGKGGVTLCGQHMLGNNYARDIPPEKREKCEECFRIAKEKGLI